MSAFASRWKQLPIAASLIGVVVVLAAAAVYTMSYRQRESYLTGRNFRLLAVLAKQTEGAIDADAHARAAAANSAPSETRTLELADGGARITLVVGTGKARRRESKKVDPILRPVFKTKIGQGAFDTVALAEPGGRLVFAVGRREWEMSSMTLSALLPGQKAADAAPPSEPAAAGKTAAPAKPATAAAAAAPPSNPLFARIAVLDAVVAGVP